METDDQQSRNPVVCVLSQLPDIYVDTIPNEMITADAYLYTLVLEVAVTHGPKPAIQCSSLTGSIHSLLHFSPADACRHQNHNIHHDCMCKPTYRTTTRS